MRHLIGFGVAMVFAATAQAQTIRVVGKVVNATNSPVSGASVELLKSKTKATTGTDGSFTLTGTTALFRGPSASRNEGFSENIRVEQGVLMMTVARTAPIQIEIFDLKGNLLKKSAVEKASAGVYKLDLASQIQGNSLVVVKASNGEESKSIPYLPTSKTSMRTNASLDFSATETMGALAKVSAVIDTLQVTATGFATKKIQMTSYDTTVNVTLDAEGDRWGGLKNPPVKSAGCGKAAGITNGKKTITSGGQSRSYTIDIPTGYDMNKAYRFFYTSHWIGSNAEAVVGQNYYFLKPLATSANEPAIFLAPQALPGNPNGTWASGANDSIDNVLFTVILKYVKENLCIDESRVFATGFSFGGMMTYSLSENRQTLIRAAVGIAPANYNIYVPPKTGLPIAWMQTTGTSASDPDRTTPWVNNDAQRRGAKYIALDHATRNGCTIPTGNNIPTWQSGAHLCYDFQGCKAGYPVKACTFNGNHTNINNDPGTNVNWIPQESWKFFTQF
jgi:poly(3-hydroxybutyrate) depolymerase